MERNREEQCFYMEPNKEWLSCLVFWLNFWASTFWLALAVVPYANGSISAIIIMHLIFGAFFTWLVLSHANYYALQPRPAIFGSTGIVRCKRCRANINPYVKWNYNGMRWRCNLCGMLNDVPSCSFSMSALFTEWRLLKAFCKWLLYTWGLHVGYYFIFFFGVLSLQENNVATCVTLFIVGTGLACLVWRFIWLWMAKEVGVLRSENVGPVIEDVEEVVYEFPLTYTKEEFEAIPVPTLQIMISQAGLSGEDKHTAEDLRNVLFVAEQVNIISAPSSGAIVVANGYSAVNSEQSAGDGKLMVHGKSNPAYAPIDGESLDGEWVCTSSNFNEIGLKLEITGDTACEIYTDGDRCPMREVTKTGTKLSAKSKWGNQWDYVLKGPNTILATRWSGQTSTFTRVGHSEPWTQKKSIEFHKTTSNVKDWMWLGWKRPDLSSCWLRVSFWCKWAPGTDPTNMGGNAGVKIHGKVYSDWMRKLTPGEWTRVECMREGPHQPDDFGWILLIMDSHREAHFLFNNFRCEGFDKDPEVNEDLEPRETMVAWDDEHDRWCNSFPLQQFKVQQRPDLKLTPMAVEIELTGDDKYTRTRIVKPDHSAAETLLRQGDITYLVNHPHWGDRNAHGSNGSYKFQSRGSILDSYGYRGTWSFLDDVTLFLDWRPQFGTDTLRTGDNGRSYQTTAHDGRIWMWLEAPAERNDPLYDW